MDCFAGEGHVVDEDCSPQYLDTIRPVSRRLWPGCTNLGIPDITDDRPPMIPHGEDSASYPVTSNDTPADDGTTIIPTKEKTSPLPRPSRLATVEERLLRLQAEFTQLAPDLLSTTTGLYQLKDSVGRLKRRLRGRQARHRSQSLQE